MTRLPPAPTSGRALALLPLLVFLVIFLGSGLYYHAIGTEFAFYQIKGPVAAIPAVILAVLLYRGKINAAIETFLQGASHPNLILMFMVFMCAGAFSSVSDSIGSVDATVQLGLSIIPADYILPMLFVMSVFIATAMGTSMGTIAACAPIAFGFTEAADISVLYAIGAVIGGAMFGDNLSMISDTTIAATRSQQVELRDKFAVNVWIAGPAALVTLGVYIALSQQATPVETRVFNPLLIIPYLAVFALAFTRLHVLAVLCIGILLSVLLGISLQPNYTLTQVNDAIYSGFTGMFEVAMLSLLLGGISAIMQREGGLTWLIQRIYKVTHWLKVGSQRAGEIGISALVIFSNIFVANNTVAIILAGDTSREVANEYGVDRKRSAALMDIFSCVVQGLIPYGAQLLLACSIAKLSPVELISNVFYCWVLGLFAIAAIVFRFPRATPT